MYDWVQIPINILDTYFYDRINKVNSNIKIAARSIFSSRNNVSKFQNNKKIN